MYSAYQSACTSGHYLQLKEKKSSQMWVLRPNMNKLGIAACLHARLTGKHRNNVSDKLRRFEGFYFNNFLQE